MGIFDFFRKKKPIETSSESYQKPSVDNTRKPVVAASPARSVSSSSPSSSTSRSVDESYVAPLYYDTISSYSSSDSCSSDSSSSSDSGGCCGCD